MLVTVAFNCMFYFLVPSGPSKDRKYSLEFVFVLLCRVCIAIIYTNMAVRWVCALVPVNCWHLQPYNQNSYEKFHQNGAISEILVKILMYRCEDEFMWNSHEKYHVKCMWNFHTEILPLYMDRALDRRLMSSGVGSAMLFFLTFFSY